MVESFFLKTGKWIGEFQNYIADRGHTSSSEAESTESRNVPKGGIVQQGKLELDVAGTEDPDTVIQRTAFIRPDGTKTDYAGEAKFKISGDRIYNPDPPERDENNGRPIEDYMFNGYIAEGHAHVLEQYTEVQENGAQEHRRNEIHYCQLDQDVLMIASVYVDGHLLVFARTTLKYQA